MEVGLDPGNFLFDGDPATPRKRAHPPHPIFGPCLLWPNGWMHEDATWYGSKPRPRPHCIRRGPSSPRKGHSSSPSFRPMSIVATVARLMLLSSCLCSSSVKFPRTFCTRNDRPTCYKIFHVTLNVLQHYLVKLENNTIAADFSSIFACETLKLICGCLYPSPDLNAKMSSDHKDWKTICNSDQKRIY